MINEIFNLDKTFKYKPDNEMSGWKSLTFFVAIFKVFITTEAMWALRTLRDTKNK